MDIVQQLANRKVLSHDINAWINMTAYERNLHLIILIAFVWKQIYKLLRILLRMITYTALYIHIT